ncbi:MAG TPA: hypothetical protein VF796_27920 [Humisphaera sp.]
MKKRFLLAAATLTASAFIGCHSTAADAPAPAAATPAAPAASTAAPVAPASETDGVRSIVLPTPPVELPEAPGRNLIAANCIICHSPSYIMMQPRFPRKVWEAEVDKMRKTFGAPVPENLVPEIVDYLMAVRGAPTPATQPAK